MQLVKEGPPAEIGFRHNGAISLQKNLARPAFATMCQPVNEQRFANHDFFDKSTYLSKVRRPRSIIPFQGFVGRDENLVAKGGDA